MFESLCTYPLRSDLFALAVHPSAPVLALGLASGHVQLNCLPTSPSPSPANSSTTFPPNSPSSIPHPVVNTITTQWSTHRHKPSCRTLSFTPNGGLHLLSAGTDGLVKLADTSTGRVCSKIALPPSHHKSSQTVDQPTLLHPLSPSTLLLATDSSAIHVYDIRSSSPSSDSKKSGPRISSKPSQTYHPHVDYVTSVTSLPSNASTSGEQSTVNPTQFLSTGGTTVAITDLRRGVLVQSEDQGEELLASALCGDKVVVGGEKGRLRVWQAGVWDDNEVEVNVNPRRPAAIESMTVVPKEEWEERESRVAIGTDDGFVSFVKIGTGRKGRKVHVIGSETIQHDEIEGALGLGFLDGGARMVTGGGAMVKVWDAEDVQEENDEDDEDEDEDEYDDEEDEEDDENGDATSNGRKRKGNLHENDSEEDSDGSDDDDDESSRKPRKKKRKRGKNKSGAKNQILRFKGLD